MKKRKVNFKVIALLVLIGISSSVFAQNGENDKTSNFSGAVTIQSKGISTIPNLTLGKPAIIFDMKVGRKLTFEPQFRFSLENGKPWAAVFWWRYNESLSNKFNLNVSTNYSLSFKSVEDPLSESSQELIRAGRYVVGTLTPSYQLTKNFGISVFLFYARGLDYYVAENTYMASFRPSFTNVPITKNISAQIISQIYYLNMNNNSGVFANSTLSLSKEDCPISIAGLISKTVDSSIPSDYDLLWNVSMTYSFGNNYKKAN